MDPDEGPNLKVSMTDVLVSGLRALAWRLSADTDVCDSPPEG